MRLLYSRYKEIWWEAMTENQITCEIAIYSKELTRQLNYYSSTTGHTGTRAVSNVHTYLQVCKEVY